MSNSRPKSAHMSSILCNPRHEPNNRVISSAYSIEPAYWLPTYIPCAECLKRFIKSSRLYLQKTKQYWRHNSTLSYSTQYRETLSKNIIQQNRCSNYYTNYIIWTNATETFLFNSLTNRPLCNTLSKAYEAFKNHLTALINKVFCFFHKGKQCMCAATHAVDTVGAHRCHELWFRTHVTEWQTIAPDMWSQNSSDLNPVDYAIWSVIQHNAACNIQRVMVHFH